jgi:hypothetical protein
MSRLNASNKQRALSSREQADDAGMVGRPDSPPR